MKKRNIMLFLLFLLIMVLFAPTKIEAEEGGFCHDGTGCSGVDGICLTGCGSGVDDPDLHHYFSGANAYCIDKPVPISTHSYSVSSGSEGFFCVLARTGGDYHAKQLAVWASPGSGSEKCRKVTDIGTGDLSINITNPDPYYSNFELSEDETYYISSPISIAYSGLVSAYKISLVDDGYLPENAVITDADGQVIANGASINKTEVYVRIPVADVTKKVAFKLSVSASYEHVSIEEYPAGSVYTASGSQTLISEPTTKKEEKHEIRTVGGSVPLKIDTGEIRVTKIDGESKLLLEGVEFNLYETNSDGTCNLNKEAKTADRKVINPIVTKVNGYQAVGNIMYGDYCLKEVKSLNTYQAIIQPVKDILDEDVLSIVIENKQIRLIVSKKAITGENELPGAIIKITDEDGVLYREFESKNEAWEEVFEKGTYILTEMIAPSGYMPVENSWKFSIDDEGNLKILSSPDEHYVLDGNHLTVFNDTAKLIISKKELSTGEELPGASIKVTCDNGFEEEFISTDKPHTIEANKLVGATCSLKETIVPEPNAKCLEELEDGADESVCEYEPITNDLKFKIDDNGNVMTIGDSDPAYLTESNRITVYNTFTLIDIPDTGIYVGIISVLVGSFMAYVGYQIIKKEKKTV